jgi:hypothetical protein
MPTKPVLAFNGCPTNSSDDAGEGTRGRSRRHFVRLSSELILDLLCREADPRTSRAKWNVLFQQGGVCSRSRFTGRHDCSGTRVIFREASFRCDEANDARGGPAQPPSTPSVGTPKPGQRCDLPERRRAVGGAPIRPLEKSPERRYTVEPVSTLRTNVGRVRVEPAWEQRQTV